MEPISIAKILQQKNPRLSRWVPGFVIRWVERVVRVKRINLILTEYGDQPPMQFIESTLNYIGVGYTVHGGEHLNGDGRYIFASNHPLGGLDGLILALVLDKFCVGGKRLIVNDLLMNLRPLAPIFVPVNKHGRQGGDYALLHDQMYSSSCQVITFPAGLCSRLIDGRVTDTPWKLTFVQKALKYGRAIVPIYIDGLNSKSFYRLALWRKRLKVGVNIEMFLLPKEMFDQSGRHINIYIGSPITVDYSLSVAGWSELIRSKCYELNPRKS